MVDRVVAGATVKHAPVVLRSEQLDQGVWREVLSDGSIVIVCDLTSALWRHEPAKPKPDQRRR